jgi:hypothetical protein
MQVERPYLWERHVTLKAFWRLLLQGRDAGALSPVATTLFLTSAAVVASGLVACVWRLRRDQREDETACDGIISLTVLTMPLLMPFYFDYDLLLLAVPAVLGARERAMDRGLTLAWIALYAWLIVNPHVAAMTRVNGTVMLLATLAMMTMARATRGAAAAAAAHDAVATAEPTPVRRAA